MSKQLSRIAPWQAGKLFAVLYFFLSLIFVIPMILIAAIAPMPVGVVHPRQIQLRRTTPIGQSACGDST